MKVSEIMNRDVMTVPQEMSVKEAARLLFEKGVSGLPVVDGQNRVVGVITEKEIISIALPKFSEELGDFDVVLNEEPFQKKILEADKVRVKDVMSKEVFCVPEETTVAEVARLMIAKKERRVPILNKDHQLAGIVARSDIVKQIARTTGII